FAAGPHRASEKSSFPALSRMARRLHLPGCDQKGSRDAMDNTLLVSLSQQLAAYQSMDVIANNIANVSTPGFRREEQTFHTYVEQLPPEEGQRNGQTLSFVQDGGVVRDMSEGPLRS